MNKKLRLNGDCFVDNNRGRGNRFGNGDGANEEQNRIQPDL